ncbi:hypothetical protein [Lentzea sp. NPDC059081]|uniref:hypothetical protein n=1 Tax=Lentzea sp. NPDC059081 TaxID=3346719 RepID=UPI0036936B7C
MRLDLPIVAPDAMEQHGQVQRRFLTATADEDAGLTAAAVHTVVARTRDWAVVADGTGTLHDVPMQESRHQAASRRHVSRRSPRHVICLDGRGLMAKASCSGPARRRP